MVCKMKQKQEVVKCYILQVLEIHIRSSKLQILDKDKS